MPRYCRNCGKTLGHDEIFCNDCGTRNPIENTIICPNCGLKTQNSLNYCENCGSNINSSKSTLSHFINKNKNIIIILITLIIVFLVVAMVATYTVGTQTVLLGTAQYEIPGDYHVEPSTVNVENYGYTVSYSKGYTNGHDFIYIGQISTQSPTNAKYVASSQGGVYKKMMGQMGYYTKYGKLYGFAFAHGNYVNIVMVNNPNIYNKISYLG